jgi:predicted RNA-binding Zn ribbon-like protein
MTLPTWVPPDEHKPAPAPLLLVQSFVNTRNLDTGMDLLADADSANEWLRQSGLLGPAATAGAKDLQAARDAREGIRALLAHNSGAPAPAAGDLRPLEAVTRVSRPQLTISPAGLIQLNPGSAGQFTAGQLADGQPADGRLADGLLGLLLIIRDAQRDGSWQRLKICGNADCRWAFYDRSHSRRGAWCDMASCGNLIKNRNLRARRGSRTHPAS